MKESPVGTIEFPIIPDDAVDDAMAFAHSLNYISETTAKTHAMILEMHSVFEKLKPLVEGMPSMPMGMPMMPPMMGRLPRG